MSDDEVEGEALEPQVLVRLEQLAHERDGVAVHDVHEQDGQIAGDAVLPQIRLAEAVADQRVAQAQARVAVEQAAGQALELQRVVEGQPEVAQLDLTVRAGQRHRPRDGLAVVVLVDERAARRPRDQTKPSTNATRAVPLDGMRTVCRSETIGSSTAPVVFESGLRSASAAGRSSGAAAADEAGAIGLVLGGAAALAAAAEQVHEIRACRAGARPPRADQRVALGDGDRLDEQIAERRMRRGPRRRARAPPRRSW